uniref:DOMON domain-containing protein n=1 Tax=Anisakis simplex TaxID=6269 RepID=A0A0M3KF23_ANISI
LSICSLFIRKLFTCNGRLFQDSTVTVIDYFSSGYGRPKIDSDQGIFDVHGVYESGYIYANFSRGLVSEDEYDLSINECIYFLYPVAGGDLEEGSGEIKKHTETPVTSLKKVCLKACGRSEDIAPTKKILTNEASVLEASVFPDESTQAIRAKYEMIIRILNREWNSRLSDGTTEEFRTMTNEVTKAIDSVMQPKWPSIKVAKVTKFVVIAHVTLTTTESNSPSAMKVKQLIEDQAVRGPVESLNIEPSTVKAIKTEIEEPENMTADQLRNWILIGLGVSLFLLAFCLVCCIVCRSCSRKRETFVSFIVFDKSFETVIFFIIFTVSMIYTSVHCVGIIIDLLKW